MKKIFLTALIVGVAIAVAIYYTAEDSSSSFAGRRGFASSDDIEDAASNAFSDLNRHAGRVERKTEDIIDQAFS